MLSYVKILIHYVLMFITSGGGYWIAVRLGAGGVVQLCAAVAGAGLVYWAGEFLWWRNRDRP